MQSSPVNLNAIFEKILTSVQSIPIPDALPLLTSIIDTLRPFSTVFSLLLMTGIAYCFFRIQHIEEVTRHHDAHAEGEEGHHGGGGSHITESATTKRWNRVVSHMESENESDWRLAILEADVLLSEMVTHMGYHGDSLGEKLKSIEASDFTSLQMAWEAHGVRNKIAHEGASFVLTEREAKRVIGLYEEVFNEFKYI
ncbi:MAG: hypothetical protein COV91_01545 [Candidatus Taylorbacteria bacterium CG11_big_fil_rev_8_21_14_0_20_46_11]|uniref:Uncharacterized protein n=1 Tax=Candidatus Taylorbacteria bacterium CG11_big_fil_rev_8_21_14_0_20_46_11 TaxID=1975025 RepID=A0A2H0KCF5_9BACT|nr:MAG: hypothetical protein COV91_01545 [Candidatus Taylorbacteria bacterium CG11_big_fil_rev_8_21_14_0_20_46_11]